MQEEAKMEKITKDTIIMDAIRKHPEAMGTFARFGLAGCAMCHLGEDETIGQGASAHGIDADGLIDALNALLEKGSSQ